MDHSFEYDFHPVGQGLFSSGALWPFDVVPWYSDPRPGPRYTWVYDCGSTSSQSLVDAAIAARASRFSPKPDLDLVTLSHFDHDHISGICKLVAKHRIDTLMLPYMALEQRLWMAFEENTGPDDQI